MISCPIVPDLRPIIQAQSIILRISKVYIVKRGDSAEITLRSA
jgi:hypothetical protein